MKTNAICAALFLMLGAAEPAPASEDPRWEQQVEQALQEGRVDDARRLAVAAAQDAVTAAVAHDFLGRISMASSRYEEAVLHFEKAREKGRALAGMAEPWSRALLKLGIGEQACAVLQDAVSSPTADNNLHYLAGTCYLGLDEPRRALPHLESAYRNGLRHSGVVTHLARAQLASGREDRAVALLAEMVEGNSSPGLLLEVGKALFQRVLYRQSIQAFRKALRAKPGWYDAGMYLALAHYLLEEYPESAKALAEMNLDPGPVEYQYLQGSVQARLGDYDRAQEELERSIRIAPERAGGYLNLGLFYLERGERDKAMELIEQGTKRTMSGAKIFYTIASRTNCHGLSPPDAVGQGDAERAQLYIDLADRLLVGRQWGSALEVYLTALHIHPTAARPYGGIGLICQELGSAEVGLKYLKKGAALHPSEPDLHFYLGSIYDYLSRPDEAITSYEQALRLGGEDKNQARYWLRLGLAQITSGQTSKAEEAFRRALEGDPGSAEAHYQLGKLRLNHRQFPEAEQLLATAVALDPFLSEAYYSWGLACIRNGEPEKGRDILEGYQKRQALRRAQVEGQGMTAEAPSLPRTEP